jgi:hypothetical protein
MTGFSTTRILSALAVLGISLTVLPETSAQLMVELKLDKTTHVMGEDVTGKIVVFNRSGRDIILDGPGNQSWLAVNLTNPAGQLVSKAQEKHAEQSVILRAGSALERQIVVNDYIEFDDYGNYGITASVYFPEKRAFFASNRERIDINDGQVFWEQVVGVPRGQLGAGSYRKYQLLNFNTTERTELFVRIRDNTGHFEYGTFSLGTIILYRDPQVTVDGDNNLNVLYMTAPRTYRHVTINTNGKIVNQKIYEEEGSNRPRMLVSKTGLINIRGGYLKEKAPAVAPGEERKELIRNISDRRIPGQ